ncbi:hypothetical protein [Phenylobacterium sp.]|uniref:hypothetical protein n=1 Tax=Phenylobacterium sp. TaxID=1871053 RepID=UPI0025E3085A|nr:hypothetical protein [Phenylobacterium sp.]
MIRETFERAVARQRQGDLAGAIAGYRRCLELDPSIAVARHNLCVALLTAGELEEGFALYDLRFGAGRQPVRKPALSFPEWSGEPVWGRSILIWPEQGAGDHIMFARFVPELVHRGARVTMLVPPTLARLFAPLPATILVAEGRVSIPTHDFWSMAGSLPGKLGVGLANLPADRYLPDAPRGVGIGIMARGNPAHGADRDRSLPPDVAARLLALPGARSLHPDDTGARDFEATAGIVRGLDLVISVDTSVAHLAGAMHKPTWILLQAQDPDWRWMRDRTDSPWYPTARLFRQPAPGDWDSVLNEVEAALRARRAAA